MQKKEFLINILFFSILGFILFGLLFLYWFIIYPKVGEFGQGFVISIISFVLLFIFIIIISIIRNKLFEKNNLSKYRAHINKASASKK